MCYDYDFEMLKRAYAEELARRQARQTEVSKKPDKTDAKEPRTVPEGKEPVPA
jgi:hypothetical protein